MDYEILQTNHVWVNDGFDPEEPYYEADGSIVQFSAGLMYPSAKEMMRCEMDRLAEELEVWGSGLAGEDFGGMNETGEYEGELDSNGISLPPKH